MKIFCFDVDGVIIDRPKCSKYPWDYYLDSNEKFKENIELINKLYDQGHYIKLQTARGFGTKIDWTEKTNKELQTFGVKYHELHFGKVDADYYVDDKLITIEQAKEIADGIDNNSTI